jgi:trehalose/maltose hydrolase-like predicted phosphorylase
MKVLRFCVSLCIILLVYDLEYAAGSDEKPHQKIPKLVCTNFPNNEAPAYLSNGLIGIRPGGNPFSHAMDTTFHSGNPLSSSQTVISGFVRTHPHSKSESIAPAPYPLETDILINGMSMLRNPENIIVKQQMLDMSCGELTTEMEFLAENNLKVEIWVVQFLSRTTPCLALQELKVTPSSDVKIQIKMKTEGLFKERNELGIALSEPKEQYYKVKAGEECIYKGIAAVVSQVYDPEPFQMAKIMTGWAKMIGFDNLRKYNKQAWEELWKSRIKIYGNSDDQQALDIAFFYVHSNLHYSNLTGIPPYGLSQFQNYTGTVFWDMDHWIWHAGLLANPKAAKSMLEYRLRGLDYAKKHARLFGFKGAQYPWQAGLDGREACPPTAHTAWDEHHITLDVALAFWEYYLATNDTDFIKVGIWPVLKNVAEWIESRGVFSDKGFEFHHLGGVDEHSIGKSNDAHFNILAKMVIKATLRCSKILSLSVPDSWQKIADQIVIPKDMSRGIVVQYEGANPVIGQAPYGPGMLQYFINHDPLSYGVVDLETFKKTYEFEEKMRVSIPAHPSNPCSDGAPGFTTPPFAACAAFFGDRDKAAQLFERTWKRYRTGPFCLSVEYKQLPRRGDYLTNHGSLLQTAIYGFTGLRLAEGSWIKYKATLPAGWDKIEIDRIWVKGKPMRLVAENGKPAVLSPVSDKDTVN